MEPTLEDFDKFNGLEFDWFAQDVTGAIGLFSTAGYGEIPVDVMRQEQNHRAIAESIPNPSFGTKYVWQDFAQVGLFVFDWKHWAGPYLKVASPLFPAPESIRNEVLKIPSLPRILLKFDEVNSVTVERFQL